MPRRPAWILASIALCLVSGCTGGSGGDSGQAPVTAPQIQTFGPTEAWVTQGTGTTLRVQFSGGTGAIDQGLGPVQSGQLVPTGYLTGDRTYTLTVTGATGALVRATCTVKAVPAPVITAFSPTDPLVAAGAGTTLRATFTGGDGRVTPGIGPVQSGTPVSTGGLNADQTFTLTVTNAAGRALTATCAVKVGTVPGAVATPAAVAGLRGRLEGGTLTADDVRRELGLPRTYLGPDATALSPAHLPESYTMVYQPGLQFAVLAGKVRECRVALAGFPSREGAEVGMAQEAALGRFAPVSGVLDSECPPMLAGFLVRRSSGEGLLPFPHQGLTLSFREGKLAAYTIRRRLPKGGAMAALKAFDDARGLDLSGLDLRDAATILPTTAWDSATLWPAADRMPTGANPLALMARALDPGLGVTALHRQGIDGRGVTVAILDQGLPGSHSEYAGRLLAYRDFTGGTQEGSYHGPAVADLLVGALAGTAPGARVLYAAVPSWNGDAADFARALDWVVEVNRTLPKEGQVRVVSCSARPSGDGSPYQNGRLWDEAVARAAAEGILVLDCTWHRAPVYAAWLRGTDPDRPADWEQGFPDGEIHDFRAPFDRMVYTPASPRTFAREYFRGEESWAYNGRGGPSWAVPYAAGLLALGWQIAPEAPGDTLLDLLRQSACRNTEGFRIADPPAFLRSVQAWKAASAPTALAARLDLQRRTIPPQEVRSLLGEPTAYGWKGTPLEASHLPVSYEMHYGEHLEILVLQGAVDEIRTRARGLVVLGGLQVGDNQERVLALAGAPLCRWTEPQPAVLLDHVLYEGTDGNALYRISAPEGLVTLHLRNGRLVQVDRRRHHPYRGQAPTTIRPLETYRGVDLRKATFPDGAAVIPQISFSDYTLWPEGLVPRSEQGPQATLEARFNPGLGLEALHGEGITGAGVTVAIIDSAYPGDHVEYAGKVEKFRGFEVNGFGMHGSAVLGRLVGTRLGVAPGAKVYFAAKPDGPPQTTDHYIQALTWILEENRALPPGRKIRAVSISAHPPLFGTAEAGARWKALVAQAEKENVWVASVETAWWGGWYPSHCPPGKDPQNPADYVSGFAGGTPWNLKDPKGLFVPTEYTVTPHETDPGEWDSYAYWAQGGLSWGIPFGVGLLALGWQVAPELDAPALFKLLQETAHRGPYGPVPDPKAFVARLKARARGL